MSSRQRHKLLGADLGVFEGLHMHLLIALPSLNDLIDLNLNRQAAWLIRLGAFFCTRKEPVGNWHLELAMKWLPLAKDKVSKSSMCDGFFCLKHNC